MTFDPTEGLKVMEELVRILTPPTSRIEICDRGLAIIGRAIRAERGVLFVRKDASRHAALVPQSTFGEPGPLADPSVAERALEAAAESHLPGGESGSGMLVLPLGDATVPQGVVLFEGTELAAGAAAFARGAAHILGVALEASERLEMSHHQGLLLVQRNVELETLRELAEALLGTHTEEGALQIALDIVLKRLGLVAGWIFWGETSLGELQLAASRGISEAFERQARETGVGTCLCRDVFATGRLRYARNTEDCPRLPELVLGSEPMVHACVPLKFERDTLGVMNIANHPGRRFAPAELQFLEIVGNHLCLAINKIRTSRAEHMRHAEARALGELAHAIGGSLELERVIAAVGDHAQALLGADRCGVFLGGEPSALRFAYRHGAGFSGLELGSDVDVTGMAAAGIAQALEDRRTIAIPSAQGGSGENADLAREWDIGSALLVPLVAHGRPEGILVAGRAVASQWTSDNAALADSLAQHAAVAIENARLFRETQDALMRLQQAQYAMMRAERLATVGTLAASLAHEVRNPLNAIHLQMVLLSRRIEKLEEGRRPELLGFVSTTQKEITRLDALVEDFLSLASPDRMNRSETDVGAFLVEVVRLLDPEARERTIRLEVSVDPAVPALSMDRERMQQVLVNLIRNGMEAMPDGGTLRVVSRQANGEVLLQITDTGQGIPPELDIYDFFTTTKKGGTGLGLPISRRIVEAHGGSLTYASQPGHGTVFTISLRS